MTARTVLSRAVCGDEEAASLCGCAWEADRREAGR